MKRAIVPILAAAGVALALASASAHDEARFVAGVPGDSVRPAATVTLVMREGDGSMTFTPDRLEVKKGEQVRFVLENKGVLVHEFRLATVKDNDEHAAMMRAMPAMKHQEANVITVDPGKTGELLWRFTRAGTFEFACLIPGHRETGMRGTVTVE